MKSSAPFDGAMASVQALGVRYGLKGGQAEQLFGLLAALTRTSAPTSVSEPEQAARVHVADSLVALELAATRSAKRIVDIGAGAGFPGLPLAVALPESEVRLLESQRRKCAFLEGVCRDVGIENALAVCVRAEEWEVGIGVHDLALARALAAQPVVLEYAAPLLRAGGTLVDWRGKRDEHEELAAARAAAELGLRLCAIHKVEPYEGARDHHLHEYRKISATPSRFPRRVGVARKRPLGC